MRPASLCFALALALPVAALAAGERAGVSAGVRGEVTLARASVGPRPVASGEDILMQDAIRSGPRSGMQILLLDQTTFTIGPDSELVVDEFVYDPRTDHGRLSARVVKGVFRFVSGKIAKENPEDVTIALPAGTIGVRGTVVAGRSNDVTRESLVFLLGEGKDNDADLPEGAIEVCNAGECVGVARAGFGVRISGADAPPTEPFAVDPAEIAAITGQLSDPSSYVETALLPGAETPDVAAGPGGADDARPASEVAGRGLAEGREDGRIGLQQVETMAAAGIASNLASQDAVRPSDVAPPPGDVPSGQASFDDLVALGGSTGTAVFQRSGIALDDTGRGGSYDFSLNIDLGQRTSTLAITNLVSDALFGAESTGFGGNVTSWSAGPAPATFQDGGLVFGSSDTRCANGCNASATANVLNGNGRLADAVTQSVTISAPGAGGVPLGTTADPSAQIPRQ